MNAKFIGYAGPGLNAWTKAGQLTLVSIAAYESDDGQTVRLVAESGNNLARIPKHSCTIPATAWADRPKGVDGTLWAQELCGLESDAIDSRG